MDILRHAENVPRLEITALDIEIIKDRESFLSIKDDWDEMVEGRFGGNPFLKHFWFTNYYLSFYSRSPIHILTARGEDGALSGAMPMVLGNRRMAGIPLKEARLLAGAHSHINRILVTEDKADTVREFFRKLIDDGVDLIFLEDVPDDFPNSEWMIDFCKKEKLKLEARSLRQSPFIPTDGTFEDYRGTLSKKFRELLNNKLNRINKAGGFDIKIFSDGEGFDAMLGDIKKIAATSWQGENRSGLFSGENNEKFYVNLIRHALENGYGRVFMLYFCEKPAAFEFHIYSGETEYCLKSEYSQEFDKVSPGGVLDLELVKRAFASDIKVYDLLGFADGYKLRWTKERTPYTRYFIFNRSAAGHTAHLLYYRIGNRLRQSGFLRRLRERRKTG